MRYNNDNVWHLPGILLLGGANMPCGVACALSVPGALTNSGVSINAAEAIEALDQLSELPRPDRQSPHPGIRDVGKY